MIMEQFYFWILFLGAVIGFITTIIIELVVICYIFIKS